MRWPKIPKEDVRVMCLLGMIFALIAISTIVIKSCNERRAEVPLLSSSDKATLELLQNEIKADSVASGHRYDTHLTDKLFAFDPNYADSATLLKLGLSNWQVSNMMKYRRNGGKWRSAEDFQRLYGLSENDFQKLKPYVRIAPQDRRAKYIPFDKTDYPNTIKGEVPHYEKIEKLQEGTTLDLAEADTAELKKIPGIGSYYASKIVKYRERLGGFVSINQLEEIEGLPPNMARWFTLTNKPTVKRIRINHASFKELVRHPYLDYEQTKDIVNHIRQYGPIRSLHELRLYKEFDEKDFQRLMPYIAFN